MKPSILEWEFGVSIDNDNYIERMADGFVCHTSISFISMHSRLYTYVRKIVSIKCTHSIIDLILLSRKKECV